MKKINILQTIQDRNEKELAPKIEKSYKAHVANWEEDTHEDEEERNEYIMDRADQSDVISEFEYINN